MKQCHLYLEEPLYDTVRFYRGVNLLEIQDIGAYRVLR
jgi:hypothetical protein